MARNKNCMTCINRVGSDSVPEFIKFCKKVGNWSFRTGGVIF